MAPFFIFVGLIGLIQPPVEGYDPRCADMFVDVYEAPEDARDDELLFNAAACAEVIGDMGAAVQLRTTLLEHYPQSDVAEPTLAALAWTYSAIAFYDHAAARYEQYAASYPQSKATPEALQNAYLFRLGLGQTEAALHNLDEFERIYQRKDPDKAAQIFWSRHELLETTKQRRDHALAYIDKYGKAGSVDRWLVAEAVVAQIDWRSSCTEPLLFDSCITLERPSKSVRRCGDPDHPVLTVHARNQKLARAAQARFDRILAAIRKTAKIDIPDHEYDRRTSYVDAWAMAMVYQADASYEDFLQLDVPDNLELVRDFMDRELSRAAELEERYAAVKLAPSPRWQLVAVSRVGMLYESFADHLSHAKLPRTVREQRQIEAHCKRIANWAQPLRERAINAWVYCLARSAVSEYDDEFSRMCETRLAALDPRFPATHELFGEPGHSPTRMRTVGVLPED